MQMVVRGQRGDSLMHRHGTVFDMDRASLSTEVMLEGIRRNLEAILQMADGSTRQLYETAIMQPLQPGARLHKEEYRTIVQVLTSRPCSQSMSVHIHASQAGG